jgi:hypothetical protein
VQVRKRCVGPARVGLASLAAAATACGSADGAKTQREAHQPQAAAGSQQTPLSGTYLGTSPDGRAWLLFIDLKDRWGSLYIPPRPLDLCQLRIDTGRVTMKWAPGYQGAQYWFEGRPEGSELVGELKGTGVWRERPPINASLRARRVSDPPGPEDIGRSGYYSNVKAPGGELGGVEFVFIQAAEHPAALLTFYQGSAGDPWTAQNLTTAGDTLRFRIRREGRDDAFEAVFGERAVTLSSRTLGLPNQHLDKRATLRELARLTYRPGCQDSLSIRR